MTFVRCVVLWWLVACGSQHAPPHEPVGSAGSAAPPPPASPPVAIAIVVEGWEMWVGNDRVDGIAEAERYFGVLRPFQDAFSRVRLKGFPSDSKATFVTYTDRAVVRAPMAPIESLSAAALGDQKDYVGVIDRDLVGGVTLGLDELAKVSGARHVLVVIGDGSDTNNDAAKSRLAELGKRAAAEHVEVVAIVYKAQLSSDMTPLTALDQNPITVYGADAIADQLDWLFVRLQQRPVVARRSGPKPLAVALLMSGWEAWLGNDEIVPAGDSSRMTGALASIRAALDRAPLTGFPDGTQATVVTYSSQTRIRYPMGPITGLGARAIGGQRDYYGEIGIDLADGVTRAITELAKVEDARRVLIVVGDGSDTNPDAATRQLRQLAKRAAELQIEVHAIVYKASLSAQDTVVTVLDPNVTTVGTADGITSELVALFERLRKH